MARVLCAVDSSPAGREAVRAAVAFCREHNADLELVGVVKEKSFFDVPQPSYGERVRGHKQVQYELTRAAEIAREAGLSPGITIRSGKLRKELLREAEATMAEEVFLARSRGWIRAALTGHARVTVVQVTLAGVARAGAEREHRKAA
jgi:hypothetical protein